MDMTTFSYPSSPNVLRSDAPVFVPGLQASDNWYTCAPFCNCEICRRNSADVDVVVDSKMLVLQDVAHTSAVPLLEQCADAAQPCIDNQVMARDTWRVISQINARFLLLNFGPDVIGKCMEDLEICRAIRRCDEICVAALGPRSVPCPCNGWQYIDPNGHTRGPFELKDMQAWHSLGFFVQSLEVRYHTDMPFIRLGDLFPNLKDAFNIFPVKSGKPKSVDLAEVYAQTSLEDLETQIDELLENGEELDDSLMAEYSRRVEGDDELKDQFEAVVGGKKNEHQSRTNNFILYIFKLRPTLGYFRPFPAQMINRIDSIEILVMGFEQLTAASNNFKHDNVLI